MSVTEEAITSPATASAVLPDVPIYRLSVEQYHAMAGHGILDENDPVELIEGWLVQKMTKHRPHSRCTLRTRRELERVLPAGWHVESQEPITTADSEPEPDVAVIRGSEDDYLDRQPGASEVALVIEIAEASLRTDRSAKLRTYARAGIAVYWIANLADRWIEVYTDPSGASDQPTYRQHHVYRPSDSIPVVLDGIEVGSVSVRDLLP